MPLLNNKGENAMCIQCPLVNSSRNICETNPPCRNQRMKQSELPPASSEFWNIGIGFGAVLAVSKKSETEIFWKRKIWTDIDWVCLVLPKNPIGRHFTSKTTREKDELWGKVEYSIWMPTMSDMLAKDWVRV